MTQNNYTDELYHYGRKGMRWGQHIFGKEPTGSSRKRSGKKSASPILNKMKTALDDRKKKKEEAEKAERRAKILKGDKKLAKEMSNEELADAIKHLELEQRYNTLATQTSTKGQEYAKAFFERAVIPGTTAAASKLMEQGLMKLGKKYLGLDDEKMKTLQDKAADAKSKFEIADYENKLKNVGKESDSIFDQAKKAKAEWELETFTKKKKDLESEERASKQKEKETKDKAAEKEAAEKEAARQAESDRRAQEAAEDSYRSYTAKNHPENRYEVPKSYPNNSTSKDYDGTVLNSGKGFISGLLGSKTSFGEGSAVDLDTGETFVAELLDRR